MINGKHVPGKGLPGAIVNIQGRNIIGVQQSNGTFSFPIVGKQFHLNSVTKKSYVLLDADATSKTYTYTRDTLFFVMETSDQILQDKLTTERQIRRSLQTKLQAREDELDSLRTIQKISQEEYQQELQRLYAEQNENDKLISNMAERYSTLDYDRMDEFYRQVSYYIEQCDLVKADSLLRSRGNISEQIENVLQQIQILEQEKKIHQQAQYVIDHDKDELAQRCYSYYEKFLLQHQNDSAAHYLAKRLRLDSTNIDWISEYAWYLSEYIADYDLALTFYDKQLKLIINSYGNDHLKLASLNNNIGLIYEKHGEYDKALNHYLQALEYGLKHNDTDYNIATYYHNIGYVYYSGFCNYKLALKYLKKAIKIRKNISDNNYDLSISYNDIGIIYWSLGKYDLALEYHQKSLDIKKELNNQLGVAYSYLNMSSVYRGIGDYNLASEYDFNALEILLEHYGKHHPEVAIIYNKLGLNYWKQGKYDLALEYHYKALELRIRTLGAEHHFTGTSYNNIGTVYLAQQNYDLAIDNYSKAVTILLKNLGEHHYEVGETYGNLGWTYYQTGNYLKAEEYIQKAYDIYLAVYGAKYFVTVRLNEILQMCKEQLNK